MTASLMSILNDTRHRNYTGLPKPHKGLLQSIKKIAVQNVYTKQVYGAYVPQ